MSLRATGDKSASAKKQLAAEAVKSDERQPDGRVMKDGDVDERGRFTADTDRERERGRYLQYGETRRGETKPSGTQGTAEQNNTIIYRSHRSAHVRLRVLSGFKTKHHTPGTTKLPCDLTDLKPCVFTPMSFFFNAIIFTNLIRKYYTLVSDGMRGGV